MEKTIITKDGKCGSVKCRRENKSLRAQWNKREKSVI